MVHLLLVDDDPVGIFQDRLEYRVQVADPLWVVLPLDVVADLLQRPRPVECDHRVDVLDAGWLQLSQIARHARTFKLEYADRLAAAEGLERGLVVGWYVQECKG